MNLKEHLQHNKADLEHKASSKTWSDIENKLFETDKIKSTYNPWTKLFGVAAAFILLVLVLWQYNETQNNNAEIIALKIAMTELLAEKSVSKRIKAVTMSEQVTNGNKEIAQVLLKTMKEDPSKNVRLAAINALNQHIENEAVRIGIIEHLAEAKDPYVQIKLINILSEIKEKKAVPTLDYIIKDTKSVLVRERAQEGIKYIKRT